MIWGFFALAACQLVGEALRESMHLPVPGPVIGMFVLTALLVSRQARNSGSLETPLDASADALIKAMGLLFVPAGAGIVAEIGLVRSAWLPLVVALAGSTLLGLVTTGLTMHWLTTTLEGRAARRLASRGSPMKGAVSAPARPPSAPTERVHD